MIGGHRHHVMSDPRTVDMLYHLIQYLSLKDCPLLPRPFPLPNLTELTASIAESLVPSLVLKRLRSI